MWSLTVGPLRPDMYAYHLVVDGVQVADPNNTVAAFTAMPPYSHLVVHGDGPAYYDARDVPHGTVARHVYHSGVTNGERELYVYTPPGYDRTKTYPVLYLVGGSGELPHNWVYDGRVNFIMDNLLAEGKAVPMVIAIPNNQVVHRNHPRHVELTFPTFEAELRKHVIPLVESLYRVRSDAKGRALSGLSMGGRHTMFVGFKSLDLFASFGVLSAGDVDSETSIAAFLNDPDVNRKVDYLFVGQGTEEAKGRMGQRCVALHEALLKHGVRHEYYVGGHGGHDWATWRHVRSYGPRFLRPACSAHARHGREDDLDEPHARSVRRRRRLALARPPPSPPRRRLRRTRSRTPRFACCRATRPADTTSCTSACRRATRRSRTGGTPSCTSPTATGTSPR